MENEIISKELFCEVMGYDLSLDCNHCGVTRLIGITESQMDGAIDLDFGYQNLESSHGRYVNLYQLAHIKCKEWAKKKGFIIESNILGTVKIMRIESLSKPIAWNFTNDNIEKHKEVIRIFKACQWILDNQNQI